MMGRVEIRSPLAGQRWRKALDEGLAQNMSIQAPTVHPAALRASALPLDGAGEPQEPA